MSNTFWDQAISKAGLLSGWHLTRRELRSAFFFDYFHQQAFAQNLHSQIDEVQRLLISQNFRTRPLRKVLAPKGPLGTRPGSHIPIRDRMVFWSIVKIIAPKLDGALSDSVYSYRLKKNPKPGELFKEGDALAVPFLKAKQITAELDPFEPWYGAWPDFEQRTQVELDDGYKFLVVSDIAAYFENINLDVLRDQLMGQLEDEPILCNFVTEGLAEWVNTSHYGSRPRRGIPQGTGISSFFGNIYLSPIDENFDNLANDYDLKYFRYMDDIRIFCRDLPTARKCVFSLESCVRRLHLNLQTAKTKILEEKSSDRQISNFLFDDRISELVDCRDLFDANKIDASELSASLGRIARSEPRNPASKRLLGVKNPKSDLTDRAMRLWMNQSIRAESSDFIGTLLKQYPTNPDTRLSRIFVNTCRAFPRHSRLGESVVEFANSQLNIHPEHEAELLRGCRYLSNIPDALWRRALSHISDQNLAFQLRVQSLLLLSCRPHSAEVYKRILKLLSSEPDAIVQPYYFSVLGQLEGDQREQLVAFFMNHPNPHNHEFGMLLRSFDRRPDIAKHVMNFVFQSDTQITDWQGALFFMSTSSNPYVTGHMLKRVRERLKHGGRVNLRRRLAAVRNRITSLIAPGVVS